MVDQVEPVSDRRVQLACRVLAAMADRRRRGLAIPDEIVPYLDEFERMPPEVRGLLDDPAVR